MLAIQQPPEEFLAQCRLDTFDKKLDEDVETIIEEVVAAVPEETELGDVDREIEVQKAHIAELNNLWVLKNAYSEAESLVSLDEFAPALAAIQTTRAKLPEFKAQELLLRDLSAQLDILEAKVKGKLDEMWAQDVRVEATAERVSLHLGAEFRAHWEIFSAKGYVPRFLGLFAQLYAPLVAANVVEIEGDEHVLHLDLGSTTTAYDLIDKVQTFALEFSSLVPQDLYEACSKEYGNKLAKDVTETLTRLAPHDVASILNYKSEVLGLKGLQEVLSSIQWVHSNTLGQFADNFGDVWNNERKATYLGRLRAALTGTFKVEAADWDWNEDEDEQDQEPDEEPREEPVAIVQEYVQQYNGSIDSFLSLFMALAPGYYRDQPIYLYLASRELVSECANLPGSLEDLQQFTNGQLDSILEAEFGAVDKVLSGPLNQAKAAAIVQETEKIATRAAPAGVKIREYILSNVVEKVSATVLDAILDKPDISETESTRLAGFIKELQKVRAYFENIEVQVPSWIKLQRLGDILSQNLMSIHAMFDNNMLVDFSSRELKGLVKALFAESDMRQQLLDLI